IPKLSERREDIPRLMQYFLLRAAEELGGDTKVLQPATEEYLMSLDWPGNVRQLENTCRWITVMASGREIHISDLPPELGQVSPSPSDATQSDWRDMLSSWARRELLHGKNQILRDALPAFEQVMIEVALQHTQGRKRDAAELLGWGRNTLTRKLKELQPHK
ncbi:MAG: helix-turn-helix domain-containing protein, partial [Pseudomonadota bacterium]